MMLVHWKVAALAALISVSGCQCADEEPGWQLYEDVELNEEFDAELPEPDLGTDMYQPPDEWVPEQIVPSVPITHALNERTSLAVDDNGTIYLGYHACENESCDRVFLTLARKPRGGEWTYERIKRQEGTFGIDVAIPEQVVAAFLDPTDNSFKVARRVAPGEFEFRTLGVRRDSPSDGLDISHDGERMFVTFANDRGDPIALFVLAQNEWRALQSLPLGVDASAAYERGLAADGQGNLYLVHRGRVGEGWGLARYSLLDGEWSNRSYYGRGVSLRPSSFLIRENGDLCISGDVGAELTVTCGRMGDLERDQWRLGEFVTLVAGGYSSMLEGSDGSLFVAYPSNGNTTLRLAKKDPSLDIWTFETVFEKSAYGVSTVIDQDDLLVISYYTCTDQRCSLEVISRPQ